MHFARVVREQTGNGQELLYGVERSYWDVCQL